MKLKSGTRIKVKSHYIRYKYLGDKNPSQGVEIKEAIVVKSAKGTEYHASDWIVCKPDNPDWQYGISNDQIIEIVGNTR